MLPNQRTSDDPRPAHQVANDFGKFKAAGNLSAETPARPYCSPSASTLGLISAK
jgi:hypothetical protein